MISSQSYIGQKGYVIPKSALSPIELIQLKKDLFKVPMINGKPNADAQGFALYRENDKKIYVPRFYGIQKYGLPTRIDICPGESIDVPFNSEKPLFPHQTTAIQVYTDHIQKSPQSAGGILELACGMGKTVLALKLISELKKKTIILVHKEFLMEQWLKRIEEFLPTAKVGKLQGPKREIEGNDIVIGMIQSIFNREFPTDMFSSFGFTIIDEVHRIGSSEFSHTLCKVVTPLILGISATVDRKDGLTDVLYSFIGPKVHSVGRKSSETQVVVRSIKYKSEDPEFNEVEYDFKGQVKYSTMMSKLCNFAPRTDFIVQVIRDTMKEKPDAQMIVLGHYRNLLVYLFQALTQGPTPLNVGYYVGGMKQSSLDASEQCQIVLATYAMAAEALDIKNLSILVLCTPKTDVIQSVGRILRTSHDEPLIIDVQDAHQVFKNQFAKRQKYYKTCQYKIVQTDNTKYTYNPLKIADCWKTVFLPDTSCTKQNEKESSDEEELEEDELNDIGLEGMEF